MDAETETRLVIAELGQRNPAVDPTLIDRLVRQRFEAYADAKIAAFVPVLVRREVRSELAGTPGFPPQGPLTTAPPSV